MTLISFRNPCFIREFAHLALKFHMQLVSNILSRIGVDCFMAKQANKPKQTRHWSSALRFLDLPAEIRNQIYRDALVFGSCQYYGSRTSSVALLSTCKQVRKEAEDILYAENEIVIRLASSQETGIKIYSLAVVRLTVNGRDVTYKQRDGRMCVEWPKVVQRIGALRVGCSLNHDPNDSQAASAVLMINHILYDLNYVLLGNLRLGRIRIDVTNNVPTAFVDPILAEMLSPLSLFGKRAHLDFQGLPRHIIRSLLDESIKTDSTDRMDVFETLDRLRREAKEYLPLLNTARISQLKIFSGVGHLLNRAQSNIPSTYSMMTVSKDKELKSNLGALDLALSHIDPDAIVKDNAWKSSRLNAEQLQSLNRLRNRKMLPKVRTSVKVHSA